MRSSLNRSVFTPASLSGDMRDQERVMSDQKTPRPPARPYAVRGTCREKKSLSVSTALEQVDRQQNFLDITGWVALVGSRQIFHTIPGISTIASRQN